MTCRDTWRGVRSCVSAALTAAFVVTLFAASVSAQDTTGVGASWNRRTNARQFGEQQGRFPFLGLDWRF
jgi:hypothetical protein